MQAAHRVLRLVIVLCASLAAFPAKGELGYRVPGTSWVLVPVGDWEPASRQMLKELAEQMPEQFRHPGHQILFRLAEAREPEPDGGHTLAEVNWAGTEIVLYTRNLDRHLKSLVGPEWAGDPEKQQRVAEYLTRRAVVHELAHVWDRNAGISTSSAWRSIAGWSWLSLIPTARPSPTTEFASPHGATSPAEDLATFAETFFFPPALQPHEADAHPKCRFPARYRLLSERLGVPPGADRVQCTRPKDVGLSAEHLRSVEILWATPTLSSISAVGGHLLLMLEFEFPEATTRETFALLADTSDVRPDSLGYVALGIAGGFTSKIVRDGYEAVAIKYQEEEGRDVRRFRWLLSNEQKRQILARLDELSLHWARPYFFFQRNCSELIIQLMNELYEDDFTPPPVIPPDLVLAELTRRGVLVPVPVSSQRDLAPITRARLLKADREAAARRLCGREFPDALSQRDEARSAAYEEMLAHANQVGTRACWSEVSRMVLLSAPLEAALRQRRESFASLPGFEALVAETLRRVPPSERVQEHEKLADIMDQRAALELTVSQDASNTPYVPMGFGVEVLKAGDQLQPFIFLEREVLNLQRGEPRLFSPARGLDLELLSFRAALGRLDEGAAVKLSHLVLDGRFMPESLFPGPEWGVYARLLEGEHRLWARAGRLRAAEAGVAVGLLRNPMRSLSLDVTLGLGVSGHYARDLQVLFEAPVRARFAWYSHGLRMPRMGVEAEFGWIPSLDLDGSWTNGGAASLAAWVYLGRLSDVGIKLRAFVQAEELAPRLPGFGGLTSGIGFVAEPY